MIIGMSMGQETCRILGQGHSVYFTGRETSRRICVVRVETDKTAGNIQARSFMARALDKIGKKIRTIHHILASSMKNYHGIIEQLHLIDQRQAKLQNELYVE